MVECAEVSVAFPPEKRKPDGQVCEVPQASELCQAFESAQVPHHACLAHLQHQPKYLMPFIN